MSSDHTVSVSALGYSEAEQRTAQQLVQDNYDELTGIARMRRRRAVGMDTLATIDILHESYLRLHEQPSWQSNEHFIKAASLAMRCVILDYARKKQAAKRGSAASDVRLDAHAADEADVLLPEFSETPEEVVAIGELLDALAVVNERWMRVVDCRYFSGMTEAETATVLNISERTARREWQAARNWLAEHLLPDPDPRA